MTIYNDICECIYRPKILRITNNLYAAVFTLMKILPAKYILEKNNLSKGSTIIETTSGTFGLGLAIISNLKGYNLIIVTDPVIDKKFERRLKDLGAEIIMVKTPSKVGGFQQGRLEKLKQLRNTSPNLFWPDQYNNKDVIKSYKTVSEVLAETICNVDILVGTVGSGGSICGTSKFLRYCKNKQLYVVGVDTHGSILFGQKDAPRLIRGLGNSIMPKNLIHSEFNEVHWVSSAEAFLSTKHLYQEHSLYMGPTSGAAYLVGKWFANNNKDKNVVVMLPDEGFRYEETVYNEDWLKDNNILFSKLPEKPVTLDIPINNGVWSNFYWNRNSYNNIVEMINRDERNIN